MHKRELHIALFYNYTDIHGTVTMDLFDTINCWRFSSYHEPMHPIAQGPKLFLAFISTIPESLTPIASRPRHAPHETAPRCTYLLRSVTKGRSGAGKSQLTSPSYAHLLAFIGATGHEPQRSFTTQENAKEGLRFAHILCWKRENTE